MMHSEQIGRIKDKLQELAGRDRHCSIFGSQVHRYQMKATLSEEAIRSFEEQHAIKLPEGYRTFLKEVGNGGAGPYYGLESMEDGRFSDLDSKDPEWLVDLSTPFPFTDRWNMDFGPVPEDDRLEQEYWEKKDQEYFDDKWVNGMLRIANFGCGVSMNLIVNGKEFGNMWVDDRGNDQGIYPEPHFKADGRVSFLDWYEDWLDQSLVKVEKKFDSQSR